MTRATRSGTSVWLLTIFIPRGHINWSGPPHPMPKFQTDPGQQPTRLTRTWFCLTALCQITPDQGDVQRWAESIVCRKRGHIWQAMQHGFHRPMFMAPSGAENWTWFECAVCHRYLVRGAE